jgi:hypothetical protein
MLQATPGFGLSKGFEGESSENVARIRSLLGKQPKNSALQHEMMLMENMEEESANEKDMV